MDGMPDVTGNTPRTRRVVTLLGSIYPSVSSLKEYLQTVIADPECKEGLELQGDSPRYISLLDTLLVCHEEVLPRITDYKQLSYQDEIIVKVVERLQRNGQNKNLLAYGVGKASGNVHSQMYNSVEVESIYPSHTRSFLMSKPWKTLLLRIGDEVMTHLLECTSLFTFAEPSCYVQLTGIPVYEVQDSPIANINPTETTGPALSSNKRGRYGVSKGIRWSVRKKKIALDLMRKRHIKRNRKMSDNVIEVTHDQKLPSDNVIKVKHDQRLPSDNVIEVTHDQRLPSDNVIEVAHDQRLPSDNVIEVAHDQRLPSDNVIEVTHDQKLPSDNVIKVKHDQRLPSDNVIEVTHDQRLPSDNVIEVTHDQRLPSDNVIEVAHDQRLPSDNVIEVAHDQRLPSDNVIEVAHDQRLPSDNVIEVAHDQRLPSDNVIEVAHDCTSPSADFIEVNNDLMTPTDAIEVTHSRKSQKRAANEMDIAPCAKRICHEKNKIKECKREDLSRKRQVQRNRKMLPSEAVSEVTYDRLSQKRAASESEIGPCAKRIRHEKRKIKKCRRGDWQKAKRRITQKNKSTEKPIRQFILKRAILYKTEGTERIPGKHFLKTLVPDKKNIKCLLKRIFILSTAKPAWWPLRSSFKASSQDSRKNEVKNSLMRTDEKCEDDENNFTAIRSRSVSSLGEGHEGRSRRQLATQDGDLNMSPDGEATPGKSKRTDADNVAGHDDTTPSSPHEVTGDDMFEWAPHLVEAFQNFVKLHRRCNYKALLDHYCPMDQTALLCMNKFRVPEEEPESPQLSAPVYVRQSKVKSSNSQTMGELQNAQNERDVGKIHKACDTSNINQHADVQSNVRKSRTAQRKTMKLKKAMANLLACHHDFKKVYVWLRACFRHAVPVKFWGTSGNQRSFFRRLYAFMKAGKFEKLSVNELTCGIKVEKMSVLADFTSHSDREMALTVILRWFLMEFCIPLLQAHFYVTDSAAFRNRLFYYRQSVWSAVQRLALDDAVGSGHFKKLTKEGAARLLARGALTVSRLRFMPKTSGVRPIIMLNNRQINAKTKTDVSANKQLKNLFHILTFIKNEDPGLLGHSVLGRDDVHKAWRQFTERRRQTNDARPLCFVKLDMQQSYDSMRQELLCDIVSKYIKGHPEYVVRRYVKVIREGGKVRRVFAREVAPLVDFDPDPLQFTMRLQQRAAPVHHAIIVDQMQQQVESSAFLVSQLEAHIKLNIVTMGGEEYLLSRGISQGSVLSPLLCSLYYGRMERDHLPEVRPCELLMRQVDDFLFVTPHLDRATRFLDVMLKGIAAFGCRVNAEKTLTSFCAPGHPLVPRLPSKEMLPWCGLLIDTETLNVRADYSAYSSLSCSDTLTFDTSFKPGNAILAKLTRCFKLQCHTVLVDSAFNGDETVIVNLYQIALLTVERFVYCERALPAKRNVHHNVSFFIRVVLDFMHVFASFYLRRCLLVKSPPSLTQDQVRWVFLAGVMRILATRRSRYRRLESIILRHQNDVCNCLTREEIARLRSLVAGIPQMCIL